MLLYLSFVLSWMSARPVTELRHYLTYGVSQSVIVLS
jgi:hypothetical protein